MFTSRSAVEDYQGCPRYRFNCYHYQGKGIVAKAKSVPLVTGSAVHRGVEHLANRVRIGQEPDVDTAVGLAVDQYVQDVEKAGFKGKGLETDKQQWFTFREQKALVEALIRAWYLVELPNLTNRYKIVAVEREVVPIEIVKNVWFQAKVDMELQEKSTGDFHNYSLKTMKKWDERSENSYKSDLQGITETWAVEEENKLLNKDVQNMLNLLERFQESQRFPLKQIQQIQDYMGKKVAEKRVMGVRFCILIKGERKNPDYYNIGAESLYITYNPLIRGYKNFSPGGVAYAHSWRYPNEDNKTGFSMLGKGWEPFNVWDSDISIKDWVQALFDGQVQPECGDVVRQHVVTPVEYFRNEKEIEVGVREIGAQEYRIWAALEQLKIREPISSLLVDRVMAEVFPHNRRQCEFHFGEVCEYKSFCWEPNVESEPFENGYEVRVPHHKAEAMEK